MIALVVSRKNQWLVAVWILTVIVLNRSRKGKTER